MIPRSTTLLLWRLWMLYFCGFIVATIPSVDAAFAASCRRPRSTTAVRLLPPVVVAGMDMPTVTTTASFTNMAALTTTTTTPASLSQQRPLMDGIRSYVVNSGGSSSSSSSQILVSSNTVPMERKIPTKEEIDQKKLTFNLWFWGGGFVAPFAATIFYFGFKFWEK